MAVGLVVLVASAFVAYRALQAGLAGSRGKEALERSEQFAADRDFDQARQALVLAEAHFDRMGDEMAGMGWLLPVVKRTPLAGSQVAAVDTMADVGTDLSRIGMDLVDAAQSVLEAPDQARIGSGLLEPLTQLQEAVRVADERLDPVLSELAALEGRWLPGPVGDAYGTLADRLPEIDERVAGIDDGLGALITFAGGRGPRQYLFFSQNPDEIRPTGGFIGTYGLLTAEAGQLALPRYEPIGDWSRPRPEVGVPGELAGPPFTLANPPILQTLGNSNSTPDWPTAAATAAELWRQGGEEPVEGVVSFVPAFLARLLRVLGPVEVPEYGERVTAGNLVERFEFYTEAAEADPTLAAERKDFVVALSQIVMDRLLSAPAQRWDELAVAVGEGFASREAMAWSTDADVADVLSERGWDAAFPETEGDFFYNSEFSYAAKNGTSLQRTFTHEVEVRRDGSGVVTTSMILANNEEPGRQNTSSLSYVTLYGPAAATLAATTDSPLWETPALEGHPGAGWLLAAPPQGRTGLTVSWEVPELLQRNEDGEWEYSLLWLHVPGHRGDTVSLEFDLPPGWAWEGEAPPSTTDLNRDLEGTWALSEDG